MAKEIPQRSRSDWRDLDERGEAMGSMRKTRKVKKRESKCCRIPDTMRDAR